jgi:hypothetical protein
LTPLGLQKLPARPTLRQDKAKRPRRIQAIIAAWLGSVNEIADCLINLQALSWHIAKAIAYSSIPSARSPLRF